MEKGFMVPDLGRDFQLEDIRYTTKGNDLLYFA